MIDADEYDWLHRIDVNEYDSWLMLMNMIAYDGCQWIWFVIDTNEFDVNEYDLWLISMNMICDWY